MIKFLDEVIDHFEEGGWERCQKERDAPPLNGHLCEGSADEGASPGNQDPHDGSLSFSFYSYFILQPVSSQETSISFAGIVIGVPT